MRIVVLDGHTLNPGDLDWEGIKALGEVTLYDRTPADQLLEQCRVADVASIHCPLTPETKGLVNKALLGRMKKTAFLLNTSRGPIVVEEDLADALASGTIAGAGLDVLSMEPPETGNPLFKAPDCIITPHIAWATLEARRRLMNMTVENLRAFVDGHPINQVNR